MAKVDSKGRVVLPKDVRERLGIAPETEVEIREEDGRAVIEPETDPDTVVDRMESLVEDAASERSNVGGQDVDDPYARDHAETIRRQAARAADDDE